MDYGWPNFLTSAPSFVAAVPRPTDLCDLLFTLRPGSVLAAGGVYAGALAWLGEQPGPPMQGEGCTPSGHNAPGYTSQRQQPLTREKAVAGAGPIIGDSGAEACSKVTAVCRSVREAVTALPDAHKYLEVVVTSYARWDQSGIKQIKSKGSMKHRAPGPGARRNVRLSMRYYTNEREAGENVFN